MDKNQERLLKLDNDKLVDVVKNYRQYGYDNELRDSAITILKDRGISKEQLQLTGNFENKSYDYANDSYSSFLKNSQIAFVIYLFLFISKVIASIYPNGSEGVVTAILITTIIALVLYFVFLIMSFLNQNRFYKSIGEDYGTEGALLYLFLGMPFYMLMYFYFRNQMKGKMKEIK